MEFEKAGLSSMKSKYPGRESLSLKIAVADLREQLNYFEKE